MKRRWPPGRSSSERLRHLQGEQRAGDRRVERHGEAGAAQRRLHHPTPVSVAGVGRPPRRSSHPCTVGPSRPSTRPDPIANSPPTNFAGSRRIRGGGSSPRYTARRVGCRCPGDRLPSHHQRGQGGACRGGRNRNEPARSGSWWTHATNWSTAGRRLPAASKAPPTRPMTTPASVAVTTDEHRSPASSRRRCSLTFRRVLFRGQAEGERGGDVAAGVLGDDVAGQHPDPCAASALATWHHSSRIQLLPGARIVGLLAVAQGVSGPVGQRRR